MADAGESEPRWPEPAELSRLRSQDPAAFTALVARTRRIVLGLGQSLGLRGADLDDAAAEAFMAIFRAMPGYEGRSAVTTWAYTIAARTLANWRERQRRHAPAALPETPIADDRAVSPEASAERNEQNERVWAAVATLEPRSAMAVELHYRRGLDLDAVAGVLECPVGTVKTLLFRARQVLKSRLQQEADAHA